jgi:hypothetical protein
MSFSDNLSDNFAENIADNSGWITVGPKKSAKKIQKKKQPKYIAKSQKRNLAITTQHKKVLSHEDDIANETENNPPSPKYDYNAYYISEDTSYHTKCCCCDYLGSGLSYQEYMVECVRDELRGR